MKQSVKRILSTLLVLSIALSLFAVHASAAGNRFEIQASNSIGLDKLVVIDSSRNYRYSSDIFSDTYGNQYNGVHEFGYSNSGDSYAIFNLNREYKTFSGSIVPSPKLESITYADYQIYVDDVAVFSKSQLDRTSSRIDFSVDVTGATKLTIKVKTYFKPGVLATGYAGEGSIVNAQLSKTATTPSTPEPNHIEPSISGISALISWVNSWATNPALMIIGYVFVLPLGIITSPIWIWFV